MGLSVAAALPAAAGPVPVALPSVRPFSGYECYLACASPAQLRTTTPTVLLGLTGPAGRELGAQIEVRTAGKKSTTVVTGDLAPLPVPREVDWRVPESALTGGATYQWRARAYDAQGRHSGWTPWQLLTVDTDRPQPVSVWSEQYPERQWGAVLGTPGEFTFTTASADTAAFFWDLDYGSNTVTPAGGTGERTATVQLTPPKDGVRVVNVQAIDPAGNVSDTTRYQFWVSPPPLRYAYWRLDETGGSTAADSGTMSADATLSGGAAFGTGYVDGSGGVVFGAPGAVTTAGPVLDPAGSFTVQAWVNPASLDGNRTVLSQEGADGTGFKLYYDAGVGAWCFGVVDEAGGAPTTACASGAMPPTVGEWRELAASYDAITAQLTVYVGGGWDCGGEQSTVTRTTATAATGPFTLGRAAGGESWLGMIDDVYARQRTLSSASICQHALQ
ncbi:LamG domain-containing protein [Catellatospora tritici]|uniref:LamG domain-containing protein n=1 Tax=Catellatospora tritici TaxID=2851566 RepID=UPI001C2D74CA|nr:LamG domain-containing protein [Catellatospora tritici]MBV1851480.1 hypothetical protein [Catellatospora tritici]